MYLNDICPSVFHILSLFSVPPWPFLWVKKLPLSKFSCCNLSFYWTHIVRSSPRDHSFLCVLHESLNGPYSARRESWVWNGLETSLKSQSLGALVGLLCSFTFNICWRTLLDLWCFISNNLFIRVLANALSELTNYFSIAFMYPQWD